jgi:hypothetical protein
MKNGSMKLESHAKIPIGMAFEFRLNNGKSI